MSHHSIPRGHGGATTASPNSLEEDERLSGFPQWTIAPPGSSNQSFQQILPSKDSSSILLSTPPSTLGQGCEIKKKPEEHFMKEHSWLLELLSLLASIASFGCLIWILFRYDEKPLAEWKTSILSLNTVVSILSVVSRGSLAFIVSACMSQCKWNRVGRRQEKLIVFDRLDDASRGLGGSLRLLWSLKTRPHWIILGAIATIALLGYGPLLQALLAFDEKVLVFEPTNSTQGQAYLSSSSNFETGETRQGGSIGRCSMLDAGSYKLSPVSQQQMMTEELPNGKEIRYPLISDLETRVDLGMSASVWNGFSPLISAQNLWPSFSCASGNCSWDLFASLAICSSCHDISNRLHKSTGMTELPIMSPMGWVENATAPAISNQNYEANYNIEPGPYRYTKYEIPSMGLNLSNYNGKSRCGPQDGGCPDTYMSAKIEENPGRTDSFSDLRTMILTLQLIEANVSWENNETTWEETPVTARECSLYYCVNAYDSRVQSGVVVENVVGSWTNRTPGSYSASPEDVSPGDMELYQKQQNYSLEKSYFLQSDLQLYVPVDVEQKFSNLQGETFNITQATIVSLQKLLTEDFSYADSSEGRDQLYLYPSLGGSIPPGFMLGLGESHDVVKTFENAALSLTKWMRDRSLQESPYLGRMMQAIIVVRVQWVYLAWPVTTLLLGFIFAGLSIWETKRMKLPAWKSSALATLAYGAGGEVAEKLRGGNDTQHLSDTAKELTVQLEYPGDRAGLVLVKQG